MAKTVKNIKHSDHTIAALRKQILGWYDKHARDLPWRVRGGRQDPYKVWLSEIMLQQTTVTAVAPYYAKFLQRWPVVQDLAAASQEEVLEAWAGLGYYSRARNLHKCAVAVVERYNGVFPSDRKALQALPGIGDYTSAAIMTIAFDTAAPVMDGNIERIIARIFNLHDALPKAKPVFKAYAGQLFEGMEQRSGDFAQALMDIGATICIPKKPRCMLCPVRELCTGQAEAETLPRKEKKKAVPHKYGIAYILEDERGRILLERRPQTGMLAGMLGFPTTEWSVDKTVDKFEGCSEVGTVRHVFTHFTLDLTVKKGAAPKSVCVDNLTPYDVDNITGLPSVFDKVYKLLR